MHSNRPLRIALIAPPWISLPPAAFGGVEAIVATLADALTDRGHHVEVFCAPGSRLRGTVHAMLDRAYPGTAIGRWGVEADFTGRVLERLTAPDARFDVVHDHSGFVLPAFAQFVRAPVVHTMHGALAPDPARFYAHHGHKSTLVALSARQLDCAAGVCRLATPADGPPHPVQARVIPNGIHVAEWPFGVEKDDHLLWIGRMQRIKGAHSAIAAARLAGQRLILAGPRQRGSDEYVAEHVEPHLDGDQIRWVGEADATAKRALYARARGLLMPIEWCEPFGLVMVEALACGTPVIAFRHGAAPDIVEHGRTGFVVDTVEEMAAAVAELPAIDPRACRASVAERFSADAMVASYEALYREVTAGRTA